MERLLAIWAALVGPTYVLLLVALLAGRRLFSEAQILYELAEPVLVILAATIALALAGVLVQIA
jgi:hypothetical protein